MKRSFARNLALILTCLTVLILATLPAYDVTVAQAKPTATPSKPTPAAEGGVQQRIIFVANKNGATNIFTMDSDGQNIVQLTKSGDYKMFPTFSPDGRKIAFLSTTQMVGVPQLMVMDSDGNNLRQLTIGDAVAISPPAWSPDSSQIAYVSVRAQPKDSGVYIIDIAQNQETKLNIVTRLDFSYKRDERDLGVTDAHAPSWSPDGKYLLVFSRLLGYEKTTLLISNSDGSARIFLQDPKIIAASAMWSPDGSKVVIEAETVQHTRLPLQITNAEGEILSELAVVQDGRVIASFPAWSPNGKQIVFMRNTFSTDKSRLYVMDIDGVIADQITAEDFSDGDFFPSWAIVPAELVKRD